MRILLGPILLIALTGCAVLRDGDGEVICSMRGFARDLSYEVESRETITIPSMVHDFGGVVITSTNARVETYHREKIGGSSTVADVLGSGAQVLGAASSLSPF